MKYHAVLRGILPVVVVSMLVSEIQEHNYYLYIKCKSAILFELSCLSPEYSTVSTVQVHYIVLGKHSWIAVYFELIVDIRSIVFFCLCFVLFLSWICSLVILGADQLEEDVLFLIEEVIIYVVLFFPWLRDVSIHRFQGKN